MPIKGKSVPEIIRMEKTAGKPQDQAVAIAMSEKERQEKNLSDGGTVKAFSPIARPQRFSGIY
jgi:hypothetical protein